MDASVLSIRLGRRLSQYEYAHEVYACVIAPVVVRLAHELYTTQHQLPESSFYPMHF